ncbi:uncharacterized protein LOC118187180 [Stegodyphus dumicola]|uniref:uncharacterized protein LOC118187180 n=1 Tax=Stegodyphus dumicola TaxID=202533 RepID=UPI0015A7FC2A|nr:uncharacterized protein LOC118187180 [Stegodyphus dumicola]
MIPPKLAVVADKITDLTPLPHTNSAATASTSPIEQQVAELTKQSYSQHAKIPAALELFAANGTKIATYGTKLLTINLNLRRSFTWPFILADVNQPIIGVDFLTKFNLLIDVKNNRLIDGQTKLYSCGRLPNVNPLSTSIHILMGNSKFDKILADYPSLTNPSQTFERPPMSTIFHHIETKGPPIFSKPRRLSPELLQAARQEFDFLLSKGIIQPSKKSLGKPPAHGS